MAKSYSFTKAVNSCLNFWPKQQRVVILALFELVDCVRFQFHWLAVHDAKLPEFCYPENPLLRFLFTRGPASILVKQFERCVPP